MQYFEMNINTERSKRNTMDKSKKEILDNFNYDFLKIWENGEYSEFQIGNDWNPDLLNLLTDLYPVIGRFNLSQQGKEEILEVNTLIDYDSFFIGPYQSRLEVLNTIDSYNEKVVSLRSLLYAEIELNTYEVNTDEFDEKYSDEINHIVRHILESTEQRNSFSFIEAAKRQLARITLSGQVYSPRQSALLEDIKYSLDLASEAVDHQTSFSAMVDCMLAIRNSGLVEYMDAIWDYYLICIYYQAIFRDIPNDLVSGYIGALSGDYTPDILRLYYEKIDQHLLIEQRDNNGNMMMLYQVDHLSSRAFYQRGVVFQLFRVLDSVVELRERYLGNGYSTRSSGRNAGKPYRKCFAVLYHRNSGRKYAAISGVCNSHLYSQPGSSTKTSSASKPSYEDLLILLKNLLGSAYTVIDSDDRVEYMYPKGKGLSSVTAFQYLHKARPSNKTYGRRMFSCSERKLATEILPGEDYDLYIKYQPCKICERLIDYKINHKKSRIHIFATSKLNAIPADDLKKFDTSASLADY